MRLSSPRSIRAVGTTLLILASIGLSVGLCTRCASVPPSPDHPMVACEFDQMQRWRYALVIERGDVVTRWVLRRTLCAVRDPYDKDVHVSSSFRVRPGYCPDESAAISGAHMPPAAFEPGREQR